MTNSEFAMCAMAVLNSSVAQILMKVAAGGTSARSYAFLFVSIALQCVSVLFAVLVLRNIALSQLIPFAALAYVLVPMGSSLVFKEQLNLRFWGGSLLIVCGVVLTQS